MSGVWPARRSTGGDAALLAGIGVCVAALGVLAFAATREPGVGMLLWAIASLALAAIGAVIALWGLAYRQLSYTLGETALEVTWFGTTTRVPYVTIDGVYTGQRLVGHAAPQVPAWPGIYVGPGRARGIGRLRFFATSPDPAALTLITLQHSGLVVSARNPHEFRLALIERLQSSAAADPAAAGPSLVMVARAPWSSLFDRWFASSIGTAIVLLLLVVMAIALGFGALPGEIPFRFNSAGEATQIAPAESVLRLPLLGFLGLVLNVFLGGWLHPRERLLARLLWLAAAVLEALVLVAVVRLLQ